MSEERQEQPMPGFTTGDKVRLKVAIAAANGTFHEAGSEHIVLWRNKGGDRVALIFGEDTYAIPVSHLELVPQPFVWPDCPERLRGSGLWLAVDANGEEWIYINEPKWDPIEQIFVQVAGGVWSFVNSDGEWACKLSLTAFPDMSHLPPEQRKVKL